MDYGVASLGIGIFMVYIVISLIVYVYLVLNIIDYFSVRVCTIIGCTIWVSSLSITVFMVGAFGFYLNTGLQGILQAYFMILAYSLLPILLIGNRHLRNSEETQTKPRFQRSRRDTVKDVLVIGMMLGFGFLCLGLLVHFDPLNTTLTWMASE